jgi:O-antigen ligase
MEIMRSTTKVGSGVETRVSLRELIPFAIFVLLGFVLIVYPFYAIGFVVVTAILAFAWLALGQMRRAGLEAWQVLLLIALSGYTLLNYGFENLAVHIGGIPIIFSYLLMYGSILLAVLSLRQSALRTLREPIVFCLLALLLLTLFHLVVDIPSYGLWALRDASMVLDGVSLFLGLFWAMRRNSTIPLLKWLMAIFLLNLAYGLSFPWSERIQELSPSSGVFLRVPVLGFYHATYIWLLAGLLFCLFLSIYVVSWPRWIIICLSLAQLFGLAIHQARSMYVALGVTLVVLLVLRETAKGTKLLLVLSSAILGLFLLTSVAGVEMSGRIGPVNLDFFKQHLRSISGAEDTPGSSVEGRVDWADQALQRFHSSPWFGVGFGLPLINWTQEDGTAVRQPHNSSLSILARLGAIGFAVWIAFHLCLLKTFVYALRHRHCWSELMSDLILWLFILYLTFMIVIHVEPGLEFPTGAVPFYFFVGLSVGLVRSQVAAARETTYSGTVDRS